MMVLDRTMSGTEDLLAVNTVSRHPQCRRWTLCRIGRHFGFVVSIFAGFIFWGGRDGDVVHDTELATLLGRPGYISY